MSREKGPRLQPFDLLRWSQASNHSYVSANHSNSVTEARLNSVQPRVSCILSPASSIQICAISVCGIHNDGGKPPRRDKHRLNYRFLETIELAVLLYSHQLRTCAGRIVLDVGASRQLRMSAGRNCARPLEQAVRELKWKNGDLDKSWTGILLPPAHASLSHPPFSVFPMFLCLACCSDAIGP